MALLACVGVDEEGFREVLAIEVSGLEKGAAYASLLQGLTDQGLKGVELVVSDDHKGIEAAVFGELLGVGWQRCEVHFERNVRFEVRRNYLYTDHHGSSDKIRKQQVATSRNVSKLRDKTDLHVHR